MWKTKDKKGAKSYVNQEFLTLPQPNVDNSWGGGRLNRKNKFVATNLLPKTPNFCSKNSLKNTKNYIKNLIYFRHTISGLFPVSCRRLNTKLNYNQYNLSKIPKQNTLIKSFLPRLQEQTNKTKL